MLKDLEVCSNGHPAIAHNGGYKGCPMCALKAELESEAVLQNLESEINDLEDQKRELIIDLEEAQREIRSLKKELAEAKGE